MPNDKTKTATAHNGTDPKIDQDYQNPRGPDDLGLAFPLVTHKGLVTYEEDQARRSLGKSSVASYRDAVAKAAQALDWLIVPSGHGFARPIGAAGLKIAALDAVDQADMDAVTARASVIEAARLEGGALTEEDVDNLIPWEAAWIMVSLGDYLDSLRALPKK